MNELEIKNAYTPVDSKSTWSSYSNSDFQCDNIDGYFSSSKINRYAMYYINAACPESSNIYFYI